MVDEIRHTALVVDADGRIDARPAVTRWPAKSELLVRLLRAGVCGTDLQILRRQRSEQVAILGHEAVGQIVGVGSEVAGWAVGQLVTFNPTNSADQHDILGHTTPGVFQQYRLVCAPELRRGLLIPFDTRLPLAYGALIEPLATVCYARALIDQVVQPRVLAVYGAGPIGLLHALYARSTPGTQVLLIHPHASRLEWAIERGIIDPSDAILAGADVPAGVAERTGGQGVDAVLLCVTRPAALAALRQALAIVRPEGCIDMVGGIGDGDQVPELPGVDLNTIRRANTCGRLSAPTYATTRSGKPVWLAGHRGASDTQLRAAMELLAQQGPRFASVISHEVPLTVAGRLLERLRTQPTRRIDGAECVKIVIDCTAAARLD